MIDIKDIPPIEIQKFILSNSYVVNELKKIGVENIANAFGRDERFSNDVVMAHNGDLIIDFNYIKCNLENFNIKLSDFDNLRVVMALNGAISGIDMWLDALYKISTNHKDWIEFKKSLEAMND